MRWGMKPRALQRARGSRLPVTVNREEVSRAANYGSVDALAEVGSFSFPPSPIGAR